MVSEFQVAIWMRLFENGRISSFSKEQNLVGTSSVPNHHTHPLPRGERQDIDQLVDYLLLLQGKLNVILGLLDEAIPDCICEVDEADLIRTTPLELVIYLVLHHLVTHYH